MARCSVKMFGGLETCAYQAEPGKKKCAKHLAKAREWDRHQYAKRKANPPPPRPDWMSDPSLLPKRPPGAR